MLNFGVQGWFGTVVIGRWSEEGAVDRALALEFDTSSNCTMNQTRQR